MRSYFSRGLLAAAIVLPALSGTARADGCSDASLTGAYAFGVTAYTPVPLLPGTPAPAHEVVAGIKVFDGQGHFTQRDFIGDSLRVFGTSDFSTGETGTYQVNADCTGTGVLTIPSPAPHVSGGTIWFNFVISNGGRHMREVVSAFTPPGFPSPVPTQTSADDWKIGVDE